MRPALRALALRLDRGTHWSDHAFGWGQLVYASAGVARVEAVDAHFVLPRARALWVPPSVRHVLHCSTALDLRTLYFPPRALPDLPATCTVLAVSPLLRELMTAVVTFSAAERQRGRARRLVAVLHDELRLAPHEPLSLSLPCDPRARRFAERFLAEPSSPLSLDDRCAEAGASRRTLERRFRAETGTSLGAWCRLARLQLALTRLGEGAAVGQVARAVGYATPSAFVASFRRAFGCTPARYIARRE